VQAVTDQIYTPTFVEDIASSAAELLERKQSGLFHLAGPQSVTREQFAHHIAQVFGFDADAICGVSTSEIARPGAAERPRDSSLDSSKAAAETCISFGKVVECLERMRNSENEWKKYSMSLRADQ
jgi:dTDP-4-dehydrorhamnose reductase